MKKLLLIPALVLFAALATADTQKVTFNVADGAKAKAAATKVAGVTKAEAKGNAVAVQLDPAKTTVQKVAQGLGSGSELVLKVGMH